MAAQKNDLGFDITGVCDGADLTPSPLDSQHALALLTKKDHTVWLHVVVRDEEKSRRFLVDEVGIDPLQAENAFDDRHIAKVVEGANTLVVEIPIMVLRSRKLDFEPLTAFVQNKLIVTVSTQPSPLINERIEQWCAGHQTQNTPAAILYGVLDAVVDSYFPVADVLQNASDDLEAEIYSGKPLNVRAALELKQELLLFRRNAAATRDALHSILRRDSPIVPEGLWPYFRDVADHTLRLVETIDLERDILSSLLDAHIGLLSNRLNEVMRYLTVIATILMTVTFISSVYGMNFHHMPELDKPWAYPAVLLLMLVVGIVQWLWFKRKGWV